MNTFIRNSLTTAILLVFLANSNAQNSASVIKKNFIFSAIQGNKSRIDSATLPFNIKSIKWINGDTSVFNITLNRKRNLQIAFVPVADFTGIARATLQLRNFTGKPVALINLTGLATKGLEGENEPTLATIVDALGYKSDIGWTNLANNTLPQKYGDEIPFSLFHKAGKEKVEMIPVARYSPDFKLPFGYYFDKDEMPEKHEVGVLAKAGTYPEHQTLFPATASGSHSFDPGSNAFGFYANGPTHSAYSEDVWNMLLFPANAVRATRIYPLKDASGKLLDNTYLVCFEEAKNGDYNDYVFLAKNVTPVTTALFTSVFNGKNLNGFHTFLQGIGKNKDPDGIFKVEDGTLHVLGKDLGYAMTDKSYKNFHLKVDFKWGESRWPPRDTAKRDAGVCYNIGMNEPDSIWPTSIEFQIQEGDVGDFWLLGFSTIKVNGVQNVPANHTRMIKQRDAEKPKGEWNTIEIISYNGKCVQVVNGVVVNVGEDASVKGGRFLLQSEFSEIYYRNVKIREL